ncbi:hypothetical protein ABZ682_09535 [Streptomyces griseoviridis]|uniref:hypothetical protein n=1 Tax=Streptomyces griseoviridis TaxID=45398 RepID=UPI0033D86AEB
MPTCLAIGAPHVARSSPRPSPADRHRSEIFHQDVVRPTCERLGLTLLRTEGIQDAGLTADQLLDLVTGADIVVVEPNGFDGGLSFGLGVRHALGRCTVHVTEGTGTPPGTARLRVVALPTDADGAVAARRHLTAIFAEALGRETVVSEPIEEAARTPQVPTSGQDENAPGLFDLMVEAEAQLEAIEGDMADVESALTDLGAMMELIAEDMARVSHPGASMKMTLAVVNRLARAIDGPAGDLEAAANRFADRMKAASVGFGAVLEWAAAMPREEWPDGFEGVLDDVVTTCSGLQFDSAAFQEILTLINLFGASSRHLRRPARRIGTSFKTMFASMAVLEEWQGTALTLQRT